MKIKIKTEVDGEDHPFLDNDNTNLNHKNIFDILRSVIHYKNMMIQSSMVREKDLDPNEIKMEKIYQQSCRNDISFVEDFVKNMELESVSVPPTRLFHVTTGKKAKLYRQTGRITGPVRGFDTLMGAMSWAIKVGRKVIFEISNMKTIPQMLPDHHNEFGNAWWTEEVSVDQIKCVYSGEESWPQPEI